MMALEGSKQFLATHFYVPYFFTSTLPSWKSSWSTVTQSSSFIVEQHNRSQVTTGDSNAIIALLADARQSPASTPITKSTKQRVTKKNYNFVVSTQKWLADEKTIAVKSGQTLADYCPNCQISTFAPVFPMVGLGNGTAILLRLKFHIQCAIPFFSSIRVSEDPTKNRVCAEGFADG